MSSDNPVNPVNPTNETAPTPVVPNPVPVQAPPTVSYSPEWARIVGGLARNFGVDITALSIALSTVVGEPSDENAQFLLNKKYVPDAILERVGVDLRIPIARVNMALEELRPAVQVTPSQGVFQNGAPGVPLGTPQAPHVSLLPQIGDGNSLVKALSNHPVLKTDWLNAAGAAKAYFSVALGLYDLPKQILALMNNTMEEMQEPIRSDSEYFKVKKLINQKKFADVLETMSDADASVVSLENQNKLFGKFKDFVIPEAIKFKGALNGWMTSYNTITNNPNIVNQGIARLMNPGLAMPVMPTRPPETTQLRNLAGAMNSALNRAFAGLGLLTARALASEGQRILDIIQVPSLPLLVGVQNREMMLNKLGLNIGFDAITTEALFCKFIASISVFSTMSPEQDIYFLFELFDVATNLDLDNIASFNPKGSKGVASSSNDDDNDLLVAKTTNKKTYRQF